MKNRLTALAAALIACTAPASANTANVDVYGVMAIDTGLPVYGTYSAAADLGTDIFSYEPVYTPLLDVATVSAATAQIAAPGYSASASTTFGSNHAYASSSAFPSTVFGTGSFSGWYDQVTISGGVGTGTMQFTVQLNGTADVGQYVGSLAYGLYTSSIHPTQLVDTLNIVDPALPALEPWALGAPLGFNDTPELTTVSTYLLGASPYNDTSILFPTQPVIGGIPSIPDPSSPLGGDSGMGFPTPDVVLTPGTGQSINVTLQGTLNFTYGESFYLIGGLGAVVMNGDAFAAFCDFSIGDCAPPPKDGTGATTLDFSNSANLVSIGLPGGATATFASGTTYNVTAVPEPGEWLMLLAGLGLVGWRVRSRA